ncbi:MAG: ribonuclease E activity regulator RraA [Pseudomonadota bacterium]
MKTADLVDDYADHLGLIQIPFRKFGQRAHCAGPIETLSCFEDNSLLKATVSTPGSGRILVVDGGGSTRTALVGDMIAEIARKNGWAGIIINGAIRDSVDIDAMDFIVFALGTTPLKSAKENIGIIGQPISMGGLQIQSGQWLYADADGVLVSDQKLI